MELLEDEFLKRQGGRQKEITLSHFSLIKIILKFVIT